MDKRRGNLIIAGIFTAVALGMVGLSFAAIPLYRAFCQATGYAGTPKIGAAVAPGGDGKTIRVRFNADTYPGLPWSFQPDQPVITVSLGEDHLASYTAHNAARTPITGIALYNVTPEKAAKYFHKTACFCFNQQTLQGGQTMDFPLSFWVDPAIDKDPDTSDVHEVTLSYTFFRTLDDAAKTGALARAGPHVGPETNAN
jgi:cytochrome c oxidase assembly protein subunit 11